MTLLQGPKDPILPSLIKVARSYNKIANKVTWLVKNRQNHANVIKVRPLMSQVDDLNPHKF